MPREIDLAEIRFARKSGAEVFRKIRPSPSCEIPLKDSAPPRTAVFNSRTNCQPGNEIHRFIGIGATLICVGFFKAELRFPIFFVEPPVLIPPPNIAERSLCCCQDCGAFIAPLPTEKSNILGTKRSLRHWLHFQKNL
jgi:hypothetical protein